MRSKHLLIHALAFSILATPAVAYGADYVLLSPLAAPGEGGLYKVSSFSQYAKTAFRIVVGMAGLITVVILIIGGIEYVSSGISGNEAARSSAHKRIWDAITGLILALSGYFILFIINPKPATFKLEIPAIGSGGGASPGGSQPIRNPATGETYAPASAESTQTTSQSPSPSVPSSQPSTTVVDPQTLLPPNSRSSYQTIDSDGTMDTAWKNRLTAIRDYQCPDGNCIRVTVGKDGNVHVADNPTFSNGSADQPDGTIIRVSNSLNPFSGSERFEWSSETGDWIFLP